MLDCNNSLHTPEYGPDLFEEQSVATWAQGVKLYQAVVIKVFYVKQVTPLWHLLCCQSTNVPEHTAMPSTEHKTAAKCLLLLSLRLAESGHHTRGNSSLCTVTVQPVSFFILKARSYVPWNIGAKCNIFHCSPCRFATAAPR